MLLKSITQFGFIAITLMVFLADGNLVRGQGIYVSGVGPVNRSMGGAGTAAPIDAIGSLNWNPGSISGLPGNELAFGVELIAVNIDMTNNIAPGSSGDAGIVSIPSIGWVHHVEGSPLTVGLGLYGVAGFKNNQPSGNALLGGNPAFAMAEFLQIAPTLSYALSESVSVGFAPTITIGEIGLDPIGPSVVTPANAPGQGNRSSFGGGFQTGIYYEGSNNVQLGFTYKSPQWMESFEFFTSPAAVPSGIVTTELDLPMILSLGAGYTGLCDWTFAADVRYFAYAETDGFRELGWNNIFGASFGVQRKLNDALTIRLGANFNEAPIRSAAAERNLITPLIQSYNLSAGGTLRIARCVDLNLAYVYLGDSSVTGPIVNLPAPPGTTVTHQIDAHSLIMGLTVHY